jgi:hypothetical protein
MSTPDFPEGFQGAGPVFAAVPLGDPWWNLAARGAVTYIPESAEVQVQAAFLDRDQAELIADAQTGGELGRWTGLCGWNDVTPARAEAELLAEFDADWAFEWDSADSDAYQARVEAGLEPEAGS